MKKLLCAMLVLVMLALPFALVTVGAESILGDDMVVDLMPDAELDKDVIKATDCEVRSDDNGSLVIKVTGSNPTLVVDFEKGGTMQIGGNVNVGEPAFFALDFGTAGSIKIDHMVFHYTRKDKVAPAVADLYMESMYSADYVKFRKQFDGATDVGSTKQYADGSVNYVVWDFGTYVSSDTKKVYDDKLHHFTQLDLSLKGSVVGSELTLFTMGIVDDEKVELGKNKPAPVEISTTSSAASTSSATSSAASSEASSAASTSSAASSEASSAASSATSSTASSTASSAASSVASSAASSEVSSEGGLGTGAIVGIIVAVVAVVAIVVVVVVVRKKK